jgi:hypothetical protein
MKKKIFYLAILAVLIYVYMNRDELMSKFKTQKAKNELQTFGEMVDRQMEIRPESIIATDSQGNYVSLAK